MAKTLFKEVQSIRQNLLWSSALIIPALVMTGVLIYQLVTGKPAGANPMSNLSLSILCVCYIVPVAVIIPFVKLTTVIDDEKISYGWNIPTAELNEIRIADIQELSVIRYKFVGYGYRFSRKYGIVYNVSGNKGLQIATKHGARILIGTGHPEQIKSAIEKIKAPVI